MELKTDSASITMLLKFWGEGDEAALHSLVEHAYSTIYNIARVKLWGERRNHTLTPTALVNEAYLKIAAIKDLRLQSRAQFFALCGVIIRNILTSHARRKLQLKRGAGQRPLNLDEQNVMDYSAAELIALDDGLKDLADLDPRKALAIEVRFFGGLSIEEAAQALAISPATLKRDLKMAKAWLSDYIANWRG